MKNMPWTGTWTVPATFPVGQVAFRILIKLKAKRTGEFVQMPVATSKLNIASERAAGLRPRPDRQAVSPITGKPVDSASTSTASTARARRALLRGSSAARRRTCSSAASSSCSAPGAWS